MRVELRTGVPVEKLAAFIEVAWLERRPELGLLCHAAAEADVPITPALVQSTLPGVSESGAKNIQRWAAYLGLCDRRGGLTGLGEHVAETDEVPVPEQGVYAMWAATHPLLGNRVLHLRRLASKRDQRFDEIVPLPFELDRDVRLPSLKDRTRHFVLRDLRPNHGVAGCIRRPCDSDLSLRWIWDIDSALDRWELDGRLDPESLPDPIQHEAESANADVRGLFASLADRELRSIGTWDRIDRTLAVSFDDLDSDAVESFSLGTQLQRVQVRGYGTFDQIHVEEIPLVPASDRDAQEWSVARLASKLVETGYRTREDVRRLWAERVEDTPLEPFGPALPSHTEMLEAAADNLAAFWSLAAPVDLSPVPVPTDALDALVAARPPTVVESKEALTVRVPHRAGWTMRDLVGRLLGGEETKRIVLCDRYVRGQQNLAVLRLLCETISTMTSGAKLEVVTDRATDERQFGAIRSIIGADPRTYHQVFGSSRSQHPHDRYLLVDAGDQSFAWQMSNSPLDARADDESQPDPDTPLRWRDLTGVRLSLSEVPLDLARLVGGDR